MNRSLAAAVVVPLAMLACNDTNLQAVPNQAPVALAYYWEGPDIESSKRVGYTMIGDAATLDGSASFDEDARGDMSFDWQLLSAPEGSSVLIDVPEEDPETEEFESAFPTFQPDVLGTYRVQLVVSDTREGVSNPAIVNVQAVPPSQLTVTLEWDVGGADLDLHVLRNDGTYFDVSGGSDCFSWSPNPDWGDPASADDNPTLDRDRDGEMQGPYRETVTLPQPQDGSEYQVLVHYFMDHVRSDGGNPQPVEATVDIKVLGQPLAPTIESPMPIQEGQVWEVRGVRWPERELSAMSPTYTTHEALGGPAYND